MKLKNINFKKIKQIACVTVALATISSSSVLAKEYIIKKGDSLSKISLREYGTIGYYNVLAVYNGIENPDFIKTGMVINIPPLQKLLDYVYDEIYTVKKGDTLSEICKEKYGTTKYVNALALHNNIENVNMIKINQTLFIPNKNKIIELKNNQKTNIYHTVKVNETLEFLSKKYYKTADFANYLKEYNCLDDYYLKPNTKIFIPDIEKIIEFYNACNEVKYVR